MFAKVQITGIIEAITGMHIGGNSSFAAIGAVDSPIIKDERSGLPIIPGSSLKGKMRSLLAKKYNSKISENPDDDDECLTDLFGSAKKGNIKTSKVIFSDMLMSNWDELKKQGLYAKTEVKFENSINRLTAVANPRQIERAIRGSEFSLDIIYEVNDNDETKAEEKLIKDMSILADGFKLLQYDYIGGNGSRGYGKIKFCNLKVDKVIGDDISESVMEECNNILNTI